MLIGCKVLEPIALEDGRILVIDEQGKLRTGYNERCNASATRLLHRAGGSPQDFVAGNTVICTKEEIR
jgi:hypothetical protein